MMKIGGFVDVLVILSSVDVVKDIMDVIKKYDVKWIVIGCGLNFFVLDEGIRGVVIKLGVGFDYLEFEGE